MTIKSKLILSIINFKVLDNENLEMVSETNERVSGRDVRNSLDKRPVEYVNEKPIKFRFGVLYVLKNGRRAWIFNKVD